MTLPLVSIVMPTYKPDFFEQALRSAIGQTYAPIEIMVSDNCPTDAIEKICRKYNGVNYFRNPKKGPPNVLSSLYLGCGEYIKPLFDDDILHPFCVEKMVRAIQLSDSIELVFSASAIIDSSNNKTSLRTPFPENGMLPGSDLYRYMVLNFVNVIGELTSIMYRRASISQVPEANLFKLDERDYAYGLADVVAFKHILRDGNSYYLKEELTYFRQDNALHSNSNQHANKNFVHCVTDWIDLLLQAQDRGAISDAEYQQCATLVANFTNRWKATFPVIEEFQAKYLKRISSLQIN